MKVHQRSAIAAVAIAIASSFSVVSHARPEANRSPITGQSSAVFAGLPDITSEGGNADRADADSETPLQTDDIGPTSVDEAADELESAVDGRDTEPNPFAEPAQNSLKGLVPFEALLGGGNTEQAVPQTKAISRGGGRSGGAARENKKKGGIRAYAGKKARGAARAAGKKFANKHQRTAKVFKTGAATFKGAKKGWDRSKGQGFKARAGKAGRAGARAGFFEGKKQWKKGDGKGKGSKK